MSCSARVFAGVSPARLAASCLVLGQSDPGCRVIPGRCASFAGGVFALSGVPRWGWLEGVESGVRAGSGLLLGEVVSLSLSISLSLSRSLACLRDISLSFFRQVYGVGALPLHRARPRHFSLSLSLFLALSLSLYLSLSLSLQRKRAKPTSFASVGAVCRTCVGGRGVGRGGGELRRGGVGFPEINRKDVGGGGGGGGGSGGGRDIFLR